MARILQIEDNNDIQKILRDFFSEEHEVIQAYSGTEGLRACGYLNRKILT